MLSKFYIKTLIFSLVSFTCMSLYSQCPDPGAPVGDNTQVICNSGTLADLIIHGNDLKYYENPVGGVDMGASTTIVNEKYYFVSQTRNGCESSRLLVYAKIGTTNAPMGSENQSFCIQGQIKDLQIQGSDIKWYADATSTNPIYEANTLVDNTYYYASQTMNNCESANRLKVKVSVHKTDAPITEGTQNRCYQQKVSDLVAQGTNIKWYRESLGGAPLDSNENLVNGGQYWSTQTLNGCESRFRHPATVSISIPKAPTGETFQTFAANQRVENLSIVGTDIKWYNKSVGGIQLLNTNELINEHTYYASQTIDGCESISRFPVKVSVASSSISSIQEKSLEIYPNPTVDKLYINSQTPINNIEVYNLQGKRVLEFKQYNSPIDISDLAPAEYFINIKTKNGAQTESILKK